MEIASATERMTVRAGTRHGLLLLSLVSVFLSDSAAVFAGDEAWRSELYPEDWISPHEREDLSFVDDRFIQDFSYAGYHRGERPLPDELSPVIDVVLDYEADPGGETDATRAIQDVIDAVGEKGGGVVYLPAGTYRLSRREGETYCLLIRHSGVVLRGAGEDRTFLVNDSVEMRGSSVILARPEGSRGFRSVDGEPISLARDYPGPAKEIELEDTGDLEEGEWIAVHNPFTDRPSDEGSFVEDLLMTEDEYGSWIGDAEHLYGPVFYRRITGIDRDNKLLRLDAPTRWYLLRRDGARVYRAGAFLEEVGLEHLAIANRRHPGSDWGVHDYREEGTPGYDVHSSWLIQFDSVRNSWMRAVHSYDPGNDNDAHLLSNGVLLRETRGVTLRDLRIGRAQYGGAGGNGYMIRMNDANENLLRNCFVHHSRHGFVFWGMSSTGNVIHRGVDETTHYQAGDTGESHPIGGRGSDHHGRFSASNLVDHGTGRDSYFEAVFRGRIAAPVAPHGQTASQSVFWNTAGEGQDYPYAVRTEQFGWGYAIGTRGENQEVVTRTGRAGAESRTRPADHVEGEGRGDSLEPASLYRDQLRLRFARR